MMLLLKTIRRLTNSIKTKRMREEHGKKNKLKSKKERKMRMKNSELMINLGLLISMLLSKLKKFNL